MSDPRVLSNVVTTVGEFEDVLGVPLPHVAAKGRATLHPVDVGWIARSPLCMVATSDAQGRCDVSPKGDPPGFVRVLGPTTLAVPERPGNRRADGFRNVLTNPHVGLLFLVPGREDTLRIDGRALPTRAEIVRAVERPDASTEELERHYGPGYAENLY